MDNPNMVPLSHSSLSLYAEVCKPVCKELYMGQTAFDIVMLLGTHPDIVTARDIVQSGGIKKNLVSMNVEKLAAQGYLDRQPMPSDRRQVKLVLTDKARPVVEKGRRVQQFYYNFLIQGLTEEELAVYQKCTRTISANVEELTRLLAQANPPLEP